MDILSLEYLHPYNLFQNGQFDELLRELRRNSIIYKENANKYKINKQQEKVILLYCSLMRSTLECYWSVILYLTTIVNTEFHMIELPTLG